MGCCFAIFPDGKPVPSALFQELADAIDWAMERYGADKFSVRHYDVARVERAERAGAPGPV